jgi:hypothetical protein
MQLNFTGHKFDAAKWTAYEACMKQASEGFGLSIRDVTTAVWGGFLQYARSNGSKFDPATGQVGFLNPSCPRESIPNVTTLDWSGGPVGASRQLAGVEPAADVSRQSVLRLSCASSYSAHFAPFRTNMALAEPFLAQPTLSSLSRAIMRPTWRTIPP